MMYTSLIKSALLFLGGCAFSSALWTPLVPDRAVLFLATAVALALTLAIDWIES